MKQKVKKIMRKIAYISVGIFVFSLGILLYNTINAHISLFLLISGVLVIVFLILGVLSRKKTKSKFLKRIRRLL